MFVGCGRLRRWTTVGQSAERHPTAPPRRWQAFFSRPAARSPIRASHCRDDSVPREEPHVHFVRVAFALKGHDTSAQGKATRVVRASPSPWVAYPSWRISPEGARQSRHRFVSPFQGFGTNSLQYLGRRYTLPRADLSQPFQGTPPRPARFRTLAGSPVPTASGQHTERARRSRTRTDPIEASDLEAGKTRQRSFQRSPGFVHERHRSRGRRA